MKKVKIQGINDYYAYIRSGSFQNIPELLQLYNYQNLIVIKDKNVRDINLEHKILELKILELDVTSKSKDINSVKEIIDFLIGCKINKKTLIIAIGGGVTLDLVGFVSSFYMRGIDVAYVPTTLMAMVDASIGSKNGINYNEYRNYLGTLYDPKFILIDPLFLKTLSVREINSGIAEIIKIAFLANEKILNLLDFEHIDWDKLIYYAVKEKSKFIEKDYKDTNERQYLNFGHTYAHAIESYYKFEKYTHGEAVAIGMCLAFPHPKLFHYLMKFNLPVQLEDNVDNKKIFDLMKIDKKNDKNKKVKIITLNDLKQPTYYYINSFADVFKAVEKVRIYLEQHKQ